MQVVVAGAVVVGGGEQEEQRRRVDAAVVARERHLAERGHLAAAHLVHDLAGLGVLGRIVAIRLSRGQEAQHAARERGVEPEHRVRRDQRVAAERRAEPGHPRVGERTGAASPR